VTPYILVDRQQLSEEFSAYVFKDTFFLQVCVLNAIPGARFYSDLRDKFFSGVCVLLVLFKAGPLNS
jgi:hypothetical protein